MNYIRKLRADFVLMEDQIMEIADIFRKAMADGLAGRGSSLKMLPSFLTRPSGREKGVYLAVDFGGTNVRAQKIELKGQGQYQILQNRLFPLRDQAMGYDLTSPKATGQQLFFLIARELQSLLAPNQSYALGFTFSFPSRQTSANRAVLLQWTKEIQTSGVEGFDVVALLQKALDDRQLKQIKPRAVINDTVGTMLASGYSRPHTAMGSICGTGHNTCYYDPRADMIINMESGNFNQVPVTDHDVRLDQQSQAPGAQRLEKMVGGQYLGELVRIIIQDLMHKKLLFSQDTGPIFLTPYALSSRDVAVWLEDTSADCAAVAAWLHQFCGGHAFLLEERITMRTVASIVVTRAAQLVAATYLGVLKHTDPGWRHRHIVAVDGALYQHMPGYARKINLTLGNILSDKSDQVTTMLTKDGSGAGAAIAAALAVGQVK